VIASGGSQIDLRTLRGLRGKANKQQQTRQKLAALYNVFTDTDFYLTVQIHGLEPQKTVLLSYNRKCLY